MRKSSTLGNGKVAIIGAGFVGASIAYALTLRDVAREIVLIDIDSKKVYGEVKDICHGLSFMGTAELYAGDYSDCEDCDLIIITAGRGRREGESRLDLLNDNLKIMRGVVDAIKEYYTRGVIMVISNPVDIMTNVVAQWMELPSGMVFGTGCVLDTSRFIRVLSDYLDLSTGVISGYIVGEHGDSQVPIWSQVIVEGVPIDEYCKNVGIEWNKAVKDRIAYETKKMGAEIIEAKKKTQYGISTCVCYLADAILNQKPVIASVCSPLSGKYGGEKITISVPSIIGSSGVHQRIQECWSPEENDAFRCSVEKIRHLLERLQI